ncbi:PQQ-like beta-propeller repeat protein [Blastopirellula sp. JC732]|uniref:PQQ-like beta-propeller repeat protein n=1 Tax=Blastopirellula sediminis TaxID=2894196 RepID=A0A9X1MKQ9_9BACT|nr:PQQ-binding-like beta-propeller repeat protein [Blastopirellula sediminis]MCC9609126.1 PQQ-like beta-propeller repeat protein [Blastopirellula sediminis]MCC9628097.1 PQQ-like beta-propeller repeat protein [Blastopirellula sediminis]
MIRSASLLLLAFAVAPISAADWPQWLGPERDSIWRESGVAGQFPESGAKIKWRVPVSYGYSGPAVADGRVFLTDYLKKTGDITNNPGGPDVLTGTERVLCFDVATGKEIWKYEYPRNYSISYGAGPRATPTVDGDKVYTLGAEGDLICFNAVNGEVVWKKELRKEFKCDAPFWGYSAAPLVDGDTLYCIVGGEGSIAVAFDKNSGKELWRALSAPSQGYCPPTMIEFAGKKQLLIWHPLSLNSLNPATGEVYWSVPLEPSYAMSISPPRQEGNLLFAGGYSDTSVLLKLTEEPGAEVLWRGTGKTSIATANAPPIVDGKTIYGVDGISGQLMAAKVEDGKRLWETQKPTSPERRPKHATAFLVKLGETGNRYILASETGDLIFADLTPEAYTEINRAHILEPTNEAFGRAVVWAHPAYANKSAYLRNDKELVCVDLAAE